MRVLSVEETRKIEMLANEYGVSYMQLMENAGSYCARIIRKTFENTNKRNVLVICGKGRNGGDGFVIARKLYENGYNVTVMMAMGLPSDELSSDMLSRVRAMGIQVVYYENSPTVEKYFEKAHIIVDCIFGVGFKGQPNETCSAIFTKINKSHATVVSIDIPSGLEGDGKNVEESCVSADITIAVLALKPAHVLRPSIDKCGEIVLAPLNIPERCYKEVSASLFTVKQEEIKSFFSKRSPQSHKGDYGTVLVIGGSYEMPNAVYFASQAAANSGAGLVKVAIPAASYNAVAPKTYEQILVPLEHNKSGRISKNSIKRLEKELEKCSCVVIGCGMGVDDDTKTVTRFVIENSEVPVILDADGINCIKDNIDIIDSAKAPIILTPHPKEMSRITGLSVEEIQSNRPMVVKEFIKKHECTLVLKGASTLVGNSKFDDLYVNTTGNPGMATGGSGDVLAGIIASFVAQKVDVFKSAIAGVNVHGAAGDKVSEKYSMMGNTPTLMLNELPSVLKILE